MVPVFFLQPLLFLFHSPVCHLIILPSPLFHVPKTTTTTTTMSSRDEEWEHTKVIDMKTLAPGIVETVARAAASQKFVPVSHLHSYKDETVGIEYMYFTLPPGKGKGPTAKDRFVKRLLPHWNAKERRRYVLASQMVRKPIVFAILGYFYTVNHERHIPLFLGEKRIEEMSLLCTTRPLACVPLFLPTPPTLPKKNKKKPSSLEWNVNDLDLAVAASTPLPPCMEDEEEENEEEEEDEEHLLSSFFHPHGHTHHQFEHDEEETRKECPICKESHANDKIVAAELQDKNQIISDFLIQIQTEDEEWTVFDPFALSPADIFIPMDTFLDTVHSHPGGHHEVLDCDAPAMLLHYCSHPEGQTALDIFVKLIKDPLYCLAVSPIRKHAKILKRMLPDPYGWID